MTPQAKRKNGRTYLRETQPEVWQTAYEMASVLSQELSDLTWAEKSFIFDQFIRELVDELMGPEGLTEISLLPIAEVMPEDDSSVQDAGQLVASVRSILTAALVDLPDKEFDELTQADSAVKALLLLISEITDHQEAGRTWIAANSVDDILEALKPLVGVTVLLLADRAGSHTIEAITSTEKLKASLDETWGEELS